MFGGNFICPYTSCSDSGPRFQDPITGSIPGKKGELSVEIDNLSFFKDDEYTGSFMKGYTLPGLWLQAKAVYYPLEMLKLEAGVHLQRFWGANRYPNMAYQDIAHWKGVSTRKGFHALPWFRAAGGLV